MLNKLVTCCLFFLVANCQLLTTPAVAAEEGAKMKKAVMIIAEDNFRDEELFVPRKVLEDNGIEVTIASTSLGLAKGVMGGSAQPDILVNDIKMKDFNAVVFVGGGGSSQYWNDPIAHKIIQEAGAGNKVVAAICIAPVTLAKAGILKGKRATVWSSEAGQLKAAGAIYTAYPVEVDGNIITASGPGAAGDFGEEIVKALEK
jgi:protease I